MNRENKRKTYEKAIIKRTAAKTALRVKYAAAR